MRQHKPQRHLRQRHPCRHILLQLLHTIHGRNQITLCKNIKSTAQSFAGNTVSLVKVPPKLPSSKRHSRNHPNMQLLASGKQLILRSLIENVVDHLHRIHQPGPHGLDPIPPSSTPFNEKNRRRRRAIISARHVAAAVTARPTRAQSADEPPTRTARPVTAPARRRRSPRPTARAQRRPAAARARRPVTTRARPPSQAVHSQSGSCQGGGARPPPSARPQRRVSASHCVRAPTITPPGDQSQPFSDATRSSQPVQRRLPPRRPVSHHHQSRATDDDDDDDERRRRRDSCSGSPVTSAVRPGHGRGRRAQPPHPQLVTSLQSLTRATSHCQSRRQPSGRRADVSRRRGRDPCRREVKAATSSGATSHATTTSACRRATTHAQSRRRRRRHAERGCRRRHQPSVISRGRRLVGDQAAAAAATTPVSAQPPSRATSHSRHQASHQTSAARGPPVMLRAVSDVAADDAAADDQSRRRRRRPSPPVAADAHDQSRPHSRGGRRRRGPPSRHQRRLTSLLVAQSVSPRS